MADLSIPGIGPGKVIGGGGSSTVFAATRTAYGDRVAVKVLKTTISSDISRRHFEREVRILTELAECPGIVAVLDSGITDRGEPYLVLPLFDRSAQTDIDANGPMPWPRAVDIIIAAAAALQHGHDRNVLHRDLKPANLLLTGNDDVFIADFGIAKLPGDSATGLTVGGYTLAYAPPEVVQGRNATFQSDIYSLAATLVALLNGQAPYSSSEQQSPLAVFSQIVDGPLPEVTADIPVELRAIIDQGRHSDPAQRYASAELFGQRLTSVSKQAAPATPVFGAEPTPPAEPPSDQTERVATDDPAPQPPSDGTRVVEPVSGEFPPPPSPPPQDPAPEQQPPISPAAAGPPSGEVPAVPPAAAGPPSGEFPAVPPAAAGPPSGEVPAVPPAAAGPPSGEFPAVPPAAAGPPSGEFPAVPPAGHWQPQAAFGQVPPAVPVQPPAGYPQAPPEAWGQPQSGYPSGPSSAPVQPSGGYPHGPSGGPPGTGLPYPDPAPPPGQQGTASKRPRWILGGVLAAVAALVVVVAVLVQSRDGDDTAGPDPTPAPDSPTTERTTSSTTSTSTSSSTTETTDQPDTGDGSPAGAVVVSPGDDLDAVITDAPDGSLVFIAAGDHVIEDAVFVERPLIIRGAGPESTTVTVTDDTQVFAFGDAAVTLADLTVTTTHSIDDSVDEGRFALVQLQGTLADTVISNIVATGGQGSGLAAFGSSLGTVANSTFADNHLSGISSSGSSALTITANTSRGNGGSGFVWFDDAGGVATANNSTDNESNGFNVDDNAAPTLTANTAVGNEFHGFILRADSTPSLIANIANDNTQSGFVWFGNGGGEAVDNRASGNGINGLAVEETGSPTLRNNLVDNNTGDDQFVADGADPTIVDTAMTVDVGEDLAAIVGDAPDGAVIVLAAGDHVIDNAIFVDRPLTIRGEGPDSTTVTVSDETQAFAFSEAAVTLADLAVTTTHSIPDDDDDNRFALVQLQDTPPETLITNVRVFGGQGSGLAAFATSEGTVTTSVFENNRFSGLSSSDTSVLTVVANTAEGNEGSGFRWRDDATSTAIANSASSNGVDGFTWFESSAGLAVSNEAMANDFDGFAAEEQSTPTLVGNRAEGNDRNQFFQADEASPILSGNDFGE